MVAEKTGLSRRTIIYYEKEANNDFLDKIEKIANGLGTTLSQLVKTDKKLQKTSEIDFSKVDTKTLLRIKQILEFTPQERSAVYKTVDGVLANKS